MANFCNVRAQAVIAALDMDTIYAVPISYHEEGMDREVLRHFGLPFEHDPDLTAVAADRGYRARHRMVRCGSPMVGKYTSPAGQL